MSKIRALTEEEMIKAETQRLIDKKRKEDPEGFCFDGEALTKASDRIKKQFEEKNKKKE